MKQGLVTYLIRLEVINPYNYCITRIKAKTSKGPQRRREQHYLWILQIEDYYVAISSANHHERIRKR